MELLVILEESRRLGADGLFFECSSRLPIDIVKYYFEGRANIQVLYTNPIDVHGQGFVRGRVYIYLSNLETTVFTGSVGEFRALTATQGKLNYSHYFDGEPEAWQKQEYKKLLKKFMMNDNHADTDYKTKDWNPFYCEGQQRRLKDYTARWHRESGSSSRAFCCDLEVNRGYQSFGANIPSLARHGRIFSAKHRRHLSPEAHLLVIGFPATAKCVYPVPWLSAIDCLDEKNLKLLSGNAFNVPTWTSWRAYCLGHTRKKPRLKVKRPLFDFESDGDCDDDDERKRLKRGVTFDDDHNDALLSVPSPWGSSKKYQQLGSFMFPSKDCKLNVNPAPNENSVLNVWCGLKL